jgi:hypothetical protein
MKRKTFIFLLVLPIIVGCVSNASVPTPTIPVDTPTPKNTPTPVPSSEDKCVEVKTGNLDELKSAGTIVLEDMHYKAYTINDNIYKKVELAKEDEIVVSIAVSPDRQLTAFYLYARNNDVSNLVIMDSSGVTQLVIPWEEDWSFISSWLDNQRLLINVYDRLSDGHPDLAAKEFSTFLVVNPFTGERELLQPNFPGIYSHHMFATWNGFGSTVYNSTLDRVVYLKGGHLSDDGFYRYVLWSIDDQRELADFKILIGEQDIPRWSPDGEKFAIALSLFDEVSNKWPAYNLYTVSRDGDVVKLTDLSKYYPWLYVGQHSWSPDGRYIAFWFSGWKEQPQTSDLFVDQNLAVIDTKNNDLSTYCISGKFQRNGMVPPPVWSPDGQQILIEGPLPDEHSQVLLLDLNRNVIATIGKDMTPVGWMVEP